MKLRSLGTSIVAFAVATLVGAPATVAHHSFASEFDANRPIEVEGVVKEMRLRFGAIIANGQGTMKGQIFRLAHLGYYDALELFAAIAGLEVALHKLGHKFELGSGVRRAQEVYLSHAG